MHRDHSELIRAFQQPHSDYGPVVMWFWNDVIDEDGITFQMEKFREQNLTNVFVHPASGFGIDYLSDRYMELICYTVQEAKRLGMYFWIYDEYRYPSGTAGGILCRDFPQYRQKEIRVEDHTLWPHDRVTITRPGQFLRAQLVQVKNGKNYVTDVSDQCKLTAHGDYTELTYWFRGATGKGRVLFFFSEVNLSYLPSGMLRPDSESIPGYVDIINKDAVAKFIELTHGRYKQFIGDEFGKTVRGVFTDEPTTLRHFDFTTATGAWNDTFAEEFRQDHGYSMLPRLYLLWDISPKSAEEFKFIHDYRHTVRRLYMTNFMDQYSQWCKDNNLIFTGHFGGEENLMAHVAQGDMLEGLTRFHIPGMDTIVSSQTIKQDTFNIAAKLPSSAAKFIGADRVLCETFSGSGWYMRFSEMKRIVNRLMLLGVNWIQYMGAYFNNGSLHKNFPYGYGPSHGYQNPYFPFYHKLGEHIASFSALSANTVPDSSVLLFLPLQQANEDRYLRQLKKMNDDDEHHALFNSCVLNTVNAMVAEGIGFELFSENLVDNIRVLDGYVEAFGYRYDVLIFPCMHFVDAKTRALIGQLKANHVKTVFLYELPQVETDSGEAFDPGFRMLPCNAALDLSQDGCTYLINPKDFPINPAIHRSALQTVIGTRHLHFRADEGVLITKRSNAGSEVWFLCNDKEQPSFASFDALPGMRILDPNTREEARYTVENGRVSLTLEGYEMLAVIRNRDGGELPVTTAGNSMERTSVTLAGPYDFTPDDGNYLLLDYEMLDPDTGLWDPCRFTYFSDHVQLEAGSPYRIRSRFFANHLPESVTINAEITRVSSLTVNGTEVPLCANVHRWSLADFTGEIGHLLQPGENCIEITGTLLPFPMLDRPPYVYLAGDFGVDADKHMVIPNHKLPAGNWAALGYPNFCGVGIYKTRFTAEEGFRKAFLTLHTRDIAEIFVNGAFAGQKLWIADETDIMPFLQAGENEIEVRITAPRANMFFAEWYPHAPHLSMTQTENGILEPMEIHYER